MKKALSLLLLFALTIIAFSACEPPESKGEKSITVIIIKDDSADIYNRSTEALYLGGALDEMAAQGVIEMITEESGLGRYIKSIGGINPGAFQWINIHSDETDITLVSENGEFTPELSYNGKIYKMTSVGIDAMPLYDGVSYIFSLGG